MKRVYCAISDLHGCLPGIPKTPDVLLVGGDIVPLQVQGSSVKSEEWIRDVFFPWALSVSPLTIFIGGNHDFYLESHGVTRIKCPEEIVYLDNSWIELGDTVIYGSPLCKIFGGWAFMYPQYEISNLLEPIVEDSRKRGDEWKKIFLTHDAPYGVSDILLQKDCMWATGEHIGNPALSMAMEKINPDINIHGHLHSTSHVPESLPAGGSTVCVSILDENYREVYKPYYFEL